MPQQYNEAHGCLLSQLRYSCDFADKAEMLSRYDQEQLPKNEASQKSRHQGLGLAVLCGAPVSVRLTATKASEPHQQAQLCCCERYRKRKSVQRERGREREREREKKRETEKETERERGRPPEREREKMSFQPQNCPK